MILKSQKTNFYLFNLSTEILFKKLIFNLRIRQSRSIYYLNNILIGNGKTFSFIKRNHSIFLFTKLVQKNVTKNEPSFSHRLNFKLEFPGVLLKPKVTKNHVLWNLLNNLQIHINRFICLVIFQNSSIKDEIKSLIKLTLMKNDLTS